MASAKAAVLGKSTKADLPELFNEPFDLAYNMMAGKENTWLFDATPTLEVVKGAVTQCDMAVWAHDLEQPGHLRASIEWFSTLPQDVKDDAGYESTKLTMPVLTIEGDKAMGGALQAQAKLVATNVASVVLMDTGHWLMEQRPAEIKAQLRKFLGN